MKIISDNPKNLLEKLELAKKQLENTKSREEKLAIWYYIYQLEKIIPCVDPEIVFEEITDKDTKINNIVDKKCDVKAEKMIKNFIIYKDFHKYFLEGIQRKNAHELRSLNRYLENNDMNTYSSITDLSEDDYYNILFEFMNKIGLAKYFDRYIKGKRIYSSEKALVNGASAVLLYNPITKDSDIVVDRMEYDIFTMCSLTHEFGHIYDMNHFSRGIECYNNHTFQTFNDEAVSKTFERLFLDYLIENNVLKEEARDILFDIYDGNYQFILTSYIISLIPDKYIIDGSYTNLSPTKIYKLVERHFSRNDPIKRNINTYGKNINIHEIYKYAYGDILSLVFKGRIKEDNYNLDSLDEFFEYRGEPFSPEILKKLGVNKKAYVKLYKKDIELLKKQSN